MLNRILLILSLVFVMSSATARELKGVNFPDEIQVSTYKLKLNGLGIRKAMEFFNVYIAALYVVEPAKNTDAIVNTKTPKRIILHFMRFVEKGKLKTAWQEGFEKNAEKSYDYHSDLNKLNEMMGHMKEKDKMVMTFFEDHTDVQLKDNPMQTFKGADFSKTLLKVFIGNPPDTDLKKGLLNL